MKIETKRYVDLDAKDISELVFAARDIDQGTSESEFVDYIEALLNEAINLVNTNSKG